MLLTVETNNERRNIDALFANANVTLSDENTGMMDALGKTMLEDLSLETALEEVLDTEAEHVIELHLGLVEDADTDETTEEGIAFEQTLGLFLVESQQLTGSLSDLGQGVLDSPDFALVTEAELADELQLLVETLLLVGASGSDVCLGSNLWNSSHVVLSREKSRKKTEEKRVREKKTRVVEKCKQREENVTRSLTE